MKRRFSILMVLVIFVTTIYSQCITAYAVNPPVIQDGGYIKVEKEEAEEQNKKKEEEFEKILKEWGER